MSISPTATPSTAIPSVKPSLRPTFIPTTLGSNAVLPAPNLTQAVFAADGSYLELTFGSLTDYGGTSILFTCSQLFSFSCASSSVCQWMDQMTVYARVQTKDSCAKVNDEVSVASAAKIRAACSSKNCNTWPIADPATNRVRIAAPGVQSLPQVMFTLPTRISSCGQLVLDVSSSVGSGGRSWSVVSMMVSSSNSSEKLRGLQSFINGSFSSSFPLVVPSSYLSVGSVYSFRSRLCNFLGACSEVSRAVQVESGFVPSVSIAGLNNVSMTRSQSLQLISVANGRDCSGKAVSVSYEWKVLQWSSLSQSSVLGVQSTSKDPSRFVLQSYGLPGRGKYEVVVTVRDATTTASSLSASASVIVNVVSGKLVALVQGSSERSMRVGDSMMLDASKSYDEDVSRSSDSSLVFQWSCVQIVAAGNSSCTSLFQVSAGQSASSIRFTAKTFDKVVTWTVSVQDVQRTRTAVASVTVKLLPPQYPIIALQSNMEGNTMNRGQSLQLTGSLNVPDGLSGNASWLLTGGSALSLSALSLTPLTRDISSSSSSQSFSMYLALPGNALTSGVSYTFALQTKLLNDVSVVVSLSSSITIAVNAPPLPGLFLVQPSSGLAYVDSFTLSCSLWTDSNLPLSYQFSYLIESNGMKSVVRGMSVVGYATSLLPAGSKARNNSMVVMADVYDSLNANTSISTTVKVVEPEQNSFNISSFITAATSSASSVDALVQGTSLSSLLLNQANCSLAPDCSKLNRNGCFSTAHTCGSCVSSALVGQVGDSNNPCRVVNSTIGVVSRQMQQCGGNCSGHGQCGFFSSLDGSAVSVCYRGEVSCYAKCVCEEGYSRSVICDKSDVEVEARSKLREQVIGGIEQLMEQQDPTEQNIAAWMNSVLQSALEQELQLTSTSINLPNCGNDSSSSGVAVSILSLSSSLYNASNFLSSPISLYLSSLPCSNSSSESCSAGITVATASYVNESKVESKNRTITCMAGDTSMQFVDCGSSAGSHVSGKETCKVSYVSMLQATTSNFKKTVLSAEGLNESTVSDSWEALVTLGTFVGAVIVAMLFSTYADKEREKKVQSEEQLKHHVKKAVLSRNRLSGDVSSPETITQLAEEALPEMLLTSESLLKRIWKEVKKHHRWVGVIYYFSKKFPRILRVMSLATNVVIMLFMQSLTYALTNGDDGSCENQTAV
eukprot:gene11892-biopygen2504